MDYYLVTLSDGSTTLLSGVPGDTSFHMQALPDGVTEVSRTKLEGMDEQQFKDLCSKAATYDISFDTISREITMTPKTQTDTVVNQ